VLLLLGLALRLIIAYVLLPGSGFPTDLSSFQGWSGQLVNQTPLGFYDKAGFLDYPPVYLLFLWILGLIFTPFGGVGESIKLIPIFGDLALAYLVFAIAQELGASQRRALIAATIVLVNPITWFNSAIWGQADVVGSLFLLLGLRALLRDRRELAAAFAVVAALTKIQLGILGILVGFVILRRSLAPREGEPDPARILTSIGSGLATAALICLPFTGLDLLGLAGRLATPGGLATLAAGLVAGLGVYLWVRRSEVVSAANREIAAIAAGAVTVVGFAAMVFGSIVSHIVNTFGEYPYLTLNAYNPWALVSDQFGNAMDKNLGWIRDFPFTDDSGATQPGFSFGPFSSDTIAALAVIAVVLVAFAAVAWLWARRSGRTDAEVAASPFAMSAATEMTAGEGTAATDIAPEAPADDGSGKPAFSFPSEMRAVAVGCLALAGVIGVLLAAQPAGGILASVVGDGLLVAVLLSVSIWAAWRDDRLSIVVALAILAIAFFVVPTRAHERYLFPFFAVGALLMAVSWRWSVAYVVLAVVNTANLLAVLVEYQGIPGVQGAKGVAGPISGLLGDWGNFLMTAEWPAGVIWPIALSAIVTGLALLWAMTQMRPRAARVLAWEAQNAGHEPDDLAEGTPWTAGPPSLFGSPPFAASPGSGGAAEFAGPPEFAGNPEFGGSAEFAGPSEFAGPPEFDWAAADAAANAAEGGELGDEETLSVPDEYFDAIPSDSRPEFVPGFVMRIWRWAFRPSIMPDRSASLLTEPRGRFDKLDLWVVVALAVVILSMRVYRLDEPYGMHFDEVYHARTATEFLQDWRYGIRHDIYEWTHPHFAKYAIAGGLVLFSDDKVTSTSNLGVPVKDALVQPRIPPATPADGTTSSDARTNQDARLGDRLFVATGTAVNAYDLQSRALEATYAIPGASALSMAADTGDMYVGTSDGRIWRIDVYSLDYVRLGTASKPAPAVELSTQTGFPIAHLYAGSPPLVLAVDATGTMVSVDGTGKIVGRATVNGAADFAPLATGAPVVVRLPSSSPTADVSAEAQAIATAMSLTPDEVASALTAATGSGLEHVVDLGSISQDQVSALQQLIDDGQLPDIAIRTDDPQVMVAYHDGVGVMDERFLTVTSTINTDQPATSIALNPNTDQESYVAAGNSILLVSVTTTGTGAIAKAPDQPLQVMPGLITKIVFDGSNKIAQALGKTQDGSAWTVYAIESNGNAVFSDARLPFDPVAIGADVTPQLPSTDRQALLALAPNGDMASVDIGQFAFAWRIVGVLFGALMAVCLYLLARFLFRRRSVGLLVALFSCVDGMLFAQSRIAMNDTYVGGFLLLAYLLFAFLWLGEKNNRKAWLSFWFGMPILGVVLGLALASKWVALYAVASIGFLILIRSALGRLITILAMAAMTGVLGWMAIAEMKPLAGTGNVPSLLVIAAVGVAVLVGGVYYAQVRARTTPDKILFVALGVLASLPIFFWAMTFYPASDQNGSPNYTFFLMMLAATAIAAAVNAYHPIAWSRQELAFGIGLPAVIGVGLGIAGIMRGSLTVMAIAAAAMVVPGAAFWVGGRLGFGPLADPPAADDPSSFAGPPAPAAQGWLRLGSGFGLPAAWMAACLIVLPLVLYIALYIPWAVPWQQETAASGPLPVLMCFNTDANGQCTSAWPAGHTGQTLMQLTVDMYNYHNDLRATHAASSPWWAWPLDLKPVWFQSDNSWPDLGSWIHDGGNPVLWWLACTGMAFICWQAFKRRSLGLALIAMAFFWQWLSWARIDRASFQYHFYTALPFFLLALAYFLAELWHGPSRRTWLLARVAAVGAAMLPAILWLGKYPLCGLARVGTSDYFGNTACGSVTGQLTVEARIFLIAVVLVAALMVLALTLLRLERRQVEEGDTDRGWVLQLVVPVAIAGGLLLWLGANGPREVIFQAALPPDLLALVMSVLGICLGILAVSARDSRRFVIGLCIFAVVVFVALYPDLSALPLPNAILGVYDAILPTWFYGFQFSDNLQPSSPVSLISSYTMAVTIAALFVALAAGYWAWVRRVINGYRRHQLLVAGLDALPAGGVEAESGGAATDGSADGGADGGSDGSNPGSGGPTGPAGPVA
jgi:hypothetical protein